MVEVQSTIQLQPDLGRGSTAPYAAREPHHQDAEARWKSEETLQVDPSAVQNWTSFSDATISFAIDTSGSTIGSRLQCEKQAIGVIGAFLSKSAREAARVLPWNSQAGPVTTLSELSSLTSYGGTDPEGLLNSNPSLAALQNSSLWFLMTDGEIPESSLQRFARGLSSSRLHGTACVVIVFGELRGRPSDCNISVGVSVFAVAPDCLFLFMDVRSNTYYLLQCKGTFTEILEQRNQQQPTLNDDAKWDDLPKIALSDLGCLRVPKHRTLHADEIYLEADLVVNLIDLFSGRITEKKTIDAILDCPEHIKTITMTAQTRGLAQKFRDWIVKQELDPLELLPPDALKVDKSASESMTTLMRKINSGSSFTIPQDGREISRLQADIRRSNAASSDRLFTSLAKSSAQSASRSTTISSMSLMSQRSSSTARAFSTPNTGPSVSIPSRPLLTPGFYISSTSGKLFEGTCPLCAEVKTTLTLLLREPSWTQLTHDFPAIGSKSNLAFPLAMGNFRETDIICPLLCCDACSLNIIQLGGNFGEDKAVCALPLVSYASNSEAYCRQLETAFQNRFDRASTPLVFVAVLCTTLQRIESKSSKKLDLLAGALRWACQDIVQSVLCPDPLTWSLLKDGSTPDFRPLRDVLRTSSEDAVRATSISYLQYPIEGFVVMTKALSETEQEKSKIWTTAKKAVFYRLLFHITEQFYKQIDSQGRVLVHMAMAQLLIMEHSRRERIGTNLGRRQFSSFHNIAGLTRSLFGDRKLLRDTLAVSFDNLIAASLLDRAFLATFKKLGSHCDWVESQTEHAVAIFVHYLYRYNTELRDSAGTHFLELAKDPALAPVFLEPSEISAGKAERLIGKLPPFGTVGS